MNNDERQLATIAPAEIMEQEDPDDAIGNRIDRPLTDMGRSQLGKLKQMAATRERVQHHCLTRALQDGVDARTSEALLNTYAKLDSAAIKQVDVENNLLGLYEPVAPGVGGKFMLVSFDGEGSVTINNNTQVNNFKESNK